MSGKEGARIFVGGLSWDTTERQLDATFSRFGKVLDVQIMLERDTGRPRGFGFVTFSDKRAMEDAISEMHNKELGGRQISVNKAEPKVASDDAGYYGYGGSGGGGGGGGFSSSGRGGYRGGGGGSGFSSSGRGGYRGGTDDPLSVGRSECFKCGRIGHWARDCPSSGGGGGGGRLSSRPRFGGGRGSYSRGDRFETEDRYADDRYDVGRYDGGRYGDRDRLGGSRDGRYGGGGGGRDRYAGDRYSPDGDRFSGDRYSGGPEKNAVNGYRRERSFDRDGGPRGGSNNRYRSGGPTRYDNYRDRPGPYDRPSRSARSSSFDSRY